MSVRAFSTRRPAWGRSVLKYLSLHAGIVAGFEGSPAGLIAPAGSGPAGFVCAPLRVRAGEPLVVVPGGMLWADHGRRSCGPEFSEVVT